MATEARIAMDLISKIRFMTVGATADTWKSILLLLEPYRDRNWLVGANSRHAANCMFSLMWAAMGDAHRHLEQPKEAAQAYRRAHEFHPGVYFADFYVAMVLRHAIEDHYESALCALDEGVAVSGQTTFRLRIISHWLSFRASPRAYLSYWKHRVLRGFRRRALARRIRNRAS